MTVSISGFRRNSGTGSSFEIFYPPATINSLMVAVVRLPTGNATAVPLSNWTRYAPAAADVTLDATYSLRVIWWPPGLSEPPASEFWGLSTSGDWSITVFAFDGVDAETPFLAPSQFSGSQGLHFTSDMTGSAGYPAAIADPTAMSLYGPGRSFWYAQALGVHSASTFTVPSGYEKLFDSTPGALENDALGYADFDGTFSIQPGDGGAFENVDTAVDPWFLVHFFVQEPFVYSPFTVSAAPLGVFDELVFDPLVFAFPVIAVGLAASATAVSASAAALSAGKRLAASVAAVATATTALSTGKPLAASVVAVATTTTTLAVAGGAALAAAAAAVSVASATLSLATPLATSAAAVAIATTALAVAKPLAASVAAVATTTTTLAVAGGAVLAAAAAAVSVASGALSLATPLAASAAAVATATTALAVSNTAGAAQAAQLINLRVAQGEASIRLDAHWAAQVELTQDQDNLISVASASDSFARLRVRDLTVQVQLVHD